MNLPLPKGGFNERLPVCDCVRCGEPVSVTKEFRLGQMEVTVSVICEACWSKE